MFEIGGSLRQAREQRRLALADAERATNIRAKYLAALEDDAFDVLPGPAYVRGFLRTYADFLGLDGALLVDEYNEHHAPPDEELQPIQPYRVARPRRLGKPAAAGAAALAAGALVVWQLGFTSSEPQRVTTAGRTGEAAAATPRRAPRPRPPAAKPAAPPRTLVVSAARGRCWVSVRVGSETGTVVWEGTLAEGRTLRFGLARKLWVRLGAPWNADVTVRGRRVGGLPHRPVDLSAA